MNFGEIKSIHFVGIGGIGMSGIAEILASAGVAVSGCDARGSAATELLTRRGIPVSIGHDPSHLDGVEMIIVTAAVKGAHPEIDAAQARGIRIVKRAEALGALVNAKRAIGVSGTHGKTTTSAMVSVVLEQAGFDPTVLVGGMVRNLKTNARTGQGDLLVVEADEYARTFHHLHPEVAIVTNIEADHLEYYGSFEAILEAFRIYLQGVKPGGVIIGCHDDAHVRQVLSELPPDAPPVVTYGLSAGAGLRATDLRFDGEGATFDIAGLGSFRLLVPGEHNVRNALAAIATGLHLGIAPDRIAAGLSTFLGVDRRFQVLGRVGGAIVVDDYAHHPTEIRATLQAARAGYPGRRIVALFQPHLFSRTRDFAHDFGAALAVADVPLVSPIYAAREEPVEGVTARIISDAVEGIEYLDLGKAGLVDELRGRLEDNDLFIVMGAGDVHEIAEALVQVEG